MNRQHIKLPRRGTSLIELVLLIAGITIILSICGGFLHLLLRLDRVGRTSFDEATAVARLGRQFRQDVRSASSAKLLKPKDVPGAGLELMLPGSKTVAYQHGGRGLVRTESESGKLLRREGFQLEPSATIAFETDDAHARLLVSRDADRSGPQSGPVLRVEARLGKDAALARLAEDSK